MYTRAWFDQNIPVWTNFLSIFKEKDIKAIELGTFEGKAAVWLAKNILTLKSELVCVDTFAGGEFIDNAIDIVQVKRNWVKNTKDYPQITLWYGDTVDYLKRRTEPADLIYVDADHTSTGTLTNAVLAHLLLKPGGIIIFDDYLWRGLLDVPDVPKRAVDAFMDCIGEYDPLYIGYQVILQKK